MRENELSILEQYDIDVKNVKKVRDAFLCESDKGLFLIKELRISERRLQLLEELGIYMREQGYENVDWLLRNKENELFTTSEEGTKYFLKRWFTGKECDNHREKDILDAVVNLTKIHRVLQSYKEPIPAGEDLRQEYFRHNREMKKVRSFMREKVGKGEFETTFLKYFDSMFACAECALERLQNSDYGDLYNESQEKHALIHGDYNYHNILMSYSGIATTNFERVQENLQVTDLYYFLRKIMEKNYWDTRLGDKMIDCYHRHLPIKKGELEYIAICLAYPEKFWKAANSYNRSRKVWIPAKNLEKLEMVIRQTEEKKQFLRTIFSFQLE